MKIKTILSLSSDDIAEPYKDCRLYTADGKSLGFGKTTISRTPSNVVVELEIDAKEIVQYIRKLRNE
jgi:hypothetical protein